MRKYMKVKCLLHISLLVVEACTLVTAVFFIYVFRLKIHDRVYTKQSQVFTFAIARGQEDKLRDVDYFRVDYTTHACPEASDDSDFIASQMIRVPRDTKDPYAEYSITLPADVLKVRLNTHYFFGKEQHSGPIAMREIVWGGKELVAADFEEYYNRKWNFYGQCYTPKPFMRGYYVEFFWLIGITVVVVFVLSALCFRKQRYDV